jgi:archaellum component FlaC
MDQYNHDTTGVMSVPTAVAETVKGSDTKIQMLEEQVKSLQMLTHKMQRDITRLKDQISELAGAIQKRG